MARPTKLTDSLKADLLDAVRLGMSFDSAAQAVGIGERTLRGWRERGSMPGARDPYKSLVDDLEMAISEGERENLRTIFAARTIDWRAAAWLLERRHPDRWGKTSDREPRTNEIDAQISANLTDGLRHDLITNGLAAFTDDELNQFMELLNRLEIDTASAQERYTALSGGAHDEAVGKKRRDGRLK